MFDPQLCRRIAVAGLLAVCTSSAHDDPLFLQDRQPRYEGPGYRADLGDPVPIFPASGINLRSWIPLPEFGPNITSGNDCWGYTSPAGKEYALIGLSHGTGFVDVSSAGNAQIVAVRSGPTSLWRDIKVYDHYAYAVSEGGGGIQVFDLSQIDEGIVSGPSTAGSGATHNVAIDEVSGFLYRIGGGGGRTGLRIYDLADPGNPVFVAEWHQRYVHDAQIVTYTQGPYAGKQIAFCFSEAGAGGGSPGIDILDVTDKANIITLSRANYSTPRFSHQGYLSPDRRFLYVDDELDEIDFGGTTQTRILDVSDLSNPFQVNTFSNGNASIDHNLYTVGDVIYAANYRSGLRVFDATDPVNLVEIGFFDTYLGDDDAHFNGLWSNYPYFASGTIIGSDLENGLFVWSTSQPDLVFTHPEELPATLDLENATVRVRLLQMGAQLAQGSVKMYYDLGEGFVEIDPEEVSTQLYEGVFPPLSCGQTVNYYFRALAQTGVTIFDPVDAPATTYRALATPSKTIQWFLDIETDDGWSVGAPSDTAFSGVWERADPVGTAYQPSEDHSPDPSSLAWITGQGVVGGADGANDVDGGETTLFSPTFDLKGIHLPTVGYWRWYSTSQDEDLFVVDMSDDGGETWINIDTAGPTGSQCSGGWMFHEVVVEDFFPRNSSVQLRFVASDTGGGSYVEAAIDDVTISSLDCGCVIVVHGDLFPTTGDGLVDLDDVLCALAGFSNELDCPHADLFPCEGNGVIDLDDILSVLGAFSGQADCPDRCLVIGNAAEALFVPMIFKNQNP